MGNRELEKKVRKIKKAKRLFPKKYAASYINVAPKADPQLIAVCRNRQPSVSFDDTMLALATMNTRFKNVPPGRKEASEFAMELQTRLRDPYILVLVQSCYFRIRMFYNNAANPTCIFFVKEDFKKRVIHQSIEYGQMSVAKSAFQRNRIIWKEYRSLPPSDPPVRFPTPQ